MLSTNPNKKITSFIVAALMQKGNKQKAELLLTFFLRNLQSRYKASPNTILIQAIKNIKPIVSFRSIKLRGASQKVPYFLKSRAQEKMTGCWLLAGVSSTRLCIVEFLIKEIVEAFFKQGTILKQRKEIYKLANQNKVFAHYRWF